MTLMKRLIILLSWVISNIAYSQNYYVQNIVELTNDLTARRAAVKDANGKGCALLRVSVPSVKNINFNSSIVGEPDFLPGEYSVFLPESSDNLSLSVNGESYHVDFADFNITIEDKKCYRIVFARKSSTSSSKSRTKITANYDNVYVLIDGVPVGQSPLQIDNIPLGKHVVSVPNTHGVTMSDTTIIFRSNNNIKLTLHEEEVKEVSILNAGGDAYGYNRYIYGMLDIEENGNKGVVDFEGNIIVPVEYDYVKSCDDRHRRYYKVCKEGKWGLYVYNEGLVIPCQYDVVALTPCERNVLVRKGSKWGVLSSKGGVVIPIIYQNCYFDCGGDVIRVVYKPSGSYYELYGVFSYDGNELIAPKYSMLWSYFTNGLAFFKKFDGAMGFTNIFGDETYLPKGYSLGSYPLFSSPLFAVRDVTSDKWGYMNYKLDLIIPCIYDGENGFAAPNFCDGIVLVSLNGNKLVFDSEGNVVVRCNESGYNDMEIVYASNGRLLTSHGYVDDRRRLIKVVNSDNQCGLLDSAGDIIVPCRYDEENIKWYCDGEVDYFALLEDEQWCLCDKQKNEILTIPSHLRITEITDGIIRVCDMETGSYGYVNIQGDVLVNCICGHGNSLSPTMSMIMVEQSISEGFAIFNIGDKYGFIDNKGNIRVPLIYTAVTPFENGVAWGKMQDGNWTRIYKDRL